ncbi:MAG: hypothetical protein LBU04_01325 [Christensenellaceae bacterium]|jgi:uncharacterized membrane protein|nr:hypothetical protein [Christensenellaceae bacterium]
MKIKKNQISKSQFITINGLFLAVILLFVVFPLQIGLVSLAVLPVLVVIIAAETVGIKSAIITGGMFGLLSFIGSMIKPTLLSQAFYNPLISVAPRLLIGVVTFLIVEALKKHFPRMNKLITYGIGAGIGVVTNTSLVLGMILVFHYGTEFALGAESVLIGWEWMTTILIANFVVEFVFCVLIAPPIVIALEHAIFRKGNDHIKTDTDTDTEL